ncbi:MAG TPA: FAD-dependent oxidoreductase [Micromonosporaceae bacterium]|jgi:NADPH-dependent 2,4-dienoyl-CoA reductase/sulfur reductase-like enzyme
MRVVVVGAGVAGVSTAAALRQRGFDGEITLVDEGPFPYDRPPLSKEYLAGRRDADQIALQPSSWYDEQGVGLLAGTPVVRLDAGAAALVLGDGSDVPADRVVLATGGSAIRPAIPGLDGEPDGVTTLRTIDDADRLRAALVPGARILVVGAGLIGAEVASTATQLGCEVTLVDPVARPLASAVGSEVAAWLHGLHRGHGVRAVAATVVGIEPGAAGLTVRLSDGDASRFDAVVLGVGMVPVTGLARAAGLEVARGVVVDAGQVTSNPAILAVGDIAQTRLDGVLRPVIGHWEAATLDAQRAAATILGTAPPPRTAPWFWTDRHHHHIEVVGEPTPGAHRVVRGTFGEPPFAVFWTRPGRVVAAVAVDQPNAVRAARRMIDRRLAVDPDALADPGTDLRALLRA